MSSWGNKSRDAAGCLNRKMKTTDSPGWCNLVSDLVSDFGSAGSASKQQPSHTQDKQHHDDHPMIFFHSHPQHSWSPHWREEGTNNKMKILQNILNYLNKRPKIQGTKISLGLTQHHESHQKHTIQFGNRSSSAVSKRCQVKKSDLSNIPTHDHRQESNKPKYAGRTNYKWYSLQTKANPILFVHTLQQQSCILGS